jgi:N-acetylneuraminate synthase|nr:N-acetylneuraminate synthase family protein [Candidatus Krumholzibacteria bacterium]
MTRFIAEISSNHNGDKRRCLELICAAADCGCWGVKFQLFRIEQLFAPEVLQASARHRDRRRWELPLHFLPDLADAARRQGLAFGCTPFDLDAVARLEPHVDFLKIASYELPWLDLVARCASTGLPLMMSSGMADEAEIVQALETAVTSGCRDLTVFHCVSNYPVDPTHCHLAALGSLRKHLPGDGVTTALGWSDHSVNPGVISRAIHHWGAEVIEFHFDLEGLGDEFTGGHCWLPEDVAPVIRGEVFAGPPDCDGSSELAATASEQEERLWRADPIDGLRPIRSIRTAWAREREPEKPAPLVLLVAGGPGLGHVARLVALAEALRDGHGFRAEFVVPDSGDANRMLARHGFVGHGAPPTLERLQNLNPALCVLDRKEPCGELVEGLKRHGVATVVIDRPDCSEAHLGIIPSFGWHPERDLPHFFGGPDYLLVRRDITRLRPDKAPIPGKRLVISFGGEDPFMLTEKTVRALAALPENLAETLEVEVVVGPGFARHRKVWPSPELAQSRVRLLDMGDPLESILPGVGLLVTAMGVTIAEAQVLGVPTAVLANYAEDAVQVAHLVESGSVANLGYQAEVGDSTLAQALADLWGRPDARQSLAEAGRQQVDGQGADRAAELVVGLLNQKHLPKDGAC